MMSGRFGDLLIREGLVGEAQIAHARAHCPDVRLGSALIITRAVAPDVINRALAQHLGLTPLKLSALEDADPAARALVPPAVARRLHAIAIAVMDAHPGRVLLVAMRDPNDLSAVDELTFAAGMKIDARVAPEIYLLGALERGGGSVTTDVAAEPSNAASTMATPALLAGGESTASEGAGQGSRTRTSTLRPLRSTGQPGAAGSSSAAGRTGRLGPIGTTAPTGPIGTAGRTGTTGPIGTAGRTGTTGPIGTTGSAGTTGPLGTTGRTGASGPIGTTGAAGATGAAAPLPSSLALAPDPYAPSMVSRALGPLIKLAIVGALVAGGVYGYRTCFKGNTSAVGTHYASRSLGLAIDFPDNGWRVAPAVAKKVGIARAEYFYRGNAPEFPIVGMLLVRSPNNQTAASAAESLLRSIIRNPKLRGCEGSDARPDAIMCLSAGALELFGMVKGVVVSVEAHAWAMGTDVILAGMIAPDKTTAETRQILGSIVNR
jgi:hypothetical protein